MMTHTDKKKLLTGPLQLMILVFIVLNAFLILGKTLLIEKGIDVTVVLAGNLILFLISFFTLSRATKAIDNPNPHVFVRVFYSGFIIRLFACAIAAFIYIYSQNGRINKSALFACLGIYIIYSLIETTSLKKIFNSRKKDA